MTDEMQVEMVEQSAESMGMVGTGGSKKPKLTKLTEAKIKDLKYLVGSKEEKNDAGDSFKQASVMIEFEFTTPLEGMTTTKEYYSYKIWKNGDKYNAGFGKKSQAGILKELICSTFGIDKDATVKELFEPLRGKTCFLITAQTSYQNESFDKTVIRQFKL